MPDHITPVPGDPSTEPVATAAQSHVDGRVGPPTIAQDATAEAYVPVGVEQIEPGTVLPADTPWEGGPLPELEDERDEAPADAQRQGVATASATEARKPSAKPAK